MIGRLLAEREALLKDLHSRKAGDHAVPNKLLADLRWLDQAIARARRAMIEACALDPDPSHGAVERILDATVKAIGPRPE